MKILWKNTRYFKSIEYTSDIENFEYYRENDISINLGRE